MIRYLKWAAKLLATGILLYWVFIQTDRQSLFKAISGSEKSILFFAFVPYLVSRVSGAFRLTTILNAAEVPLSHASGLRLNWISMFYGMFLPGGLGGDAYKLIRLRALFPDKGVLLLTRTLLWDRLIGLVVLTILTVSFAMPYLLVIYQVVAASLALIGCLVFWLATRRWIPQLLPYMGRLLVFSLVVQLTQIACIFMLLSSIQIHEHYNQYNVLFLVSSVASTLPISVGGVGVREVVFLEGAQLLMVSAQAAVTVSVLFDIIVTLTAATGSLAILGNARVVSTSASK
ncbi:lysylphosphatidylglycerol synthase domain-containing protein [Dyadobacter pollutisoli]|uniref:Lysylphosphatidylglycerol synthase domain-containing protein n=1 Tax=Dyadobacter pollutisoli TaxID=2910158 RepID=A0A9E8SKM9_9BACT|nr:lysylphosphatidylglycerol synthase domain-containing protein [Dyadobacter pollutisoli]WAC12675.1 lysylphosphatidylglycerol synthase domain-containing protein [Dyadobacter pollutisoli]